MAIVPSKRWTVKDVLSMVRELTKTVDQRKVLQEQGKYFYNTALSEIVALLNGSLDPAFFYRETITLAADIEHMLITSAGGAAYIEATDATLHTIKKYVGAGATQWKVGQVIHVVFVNTATLVITQFTAKITVVNNTTNTATYSVLTGTEMTWPAANVIGGVTIISTLSTLAFDTNTLSKSLDRVVAIVDSLKGLCVPLTQNEFYSIDRADFAHKSYDDDIVWTQVGNTLYFRNGPGITAGVKTIIYQRQPDYPILYDDSEYVDIADRNVPLLAKRIYTYIILQQENDVPKNLSQEMAMDYQQIAALASAEIENKKDKK